MGWQRGEEKGAQEGRKLRRNIYADFISVWVPALESGKLMTLIPKLVCLELCTRPAPSPSGRAAPAPAPALARALVGPSVWSGEGLGWAGLGWGRGGGEKKGRGGGAGRGRPS